MFRARNTTCFERAGQQVHGHVPIGVRNAHPLVSGLHIPPLVGARSARDLAEKLDHSLPQTFVKRRLGEVAAEPRVGKDARHEMSVTAAITSRPPSRP